MSDDSIDEFVEKIKALVEPINEENEQLKTEIERLRDEWCSPRNAQDLSLWRCKCGGWSVQSHVCQGCGHDPSWEK